MGYEQIRLKQNTAAPRRDFSASVPKPTITIQPSPLQHYRDIGNQAVQRMLETRVIQAKLTIGQPNDIYEQEADRVADQVMSMPEGSLVNGHLSLGKREKESSLVQRKSSCPECEEEEEDLIQTKGEGSSPLEVTSGMESRLESLKDGGQPLSESIRSYFEPRFGSDFSRVRIHNDSQAVETAKSVNAKAFTAGKNVVFGLGQYSPEKSSGKKLIAHELTHVVQQTRGKIIGKQDIRQHRYQCHLIQRDEIDEIERGLEETLPAELGSVEYVKNTFMARISDMNDFRLVAQSYQIPPNQLLAIIIREGYFMENAYYKDPGPNYPALNSDPAGLVSWHLWRTHGMDDFAVVIPRSPGSTDNSFNSSSRGHRSAMLRTLSDFYAKGLLWDEQGLRPSDPTQQQTPNQIMDRLIEQIDVGTRLPREGFSRLAFRIVAAAVSSRLHAMNRGREELESLGYEQEDIDRFSYGSVERLCIRIAEANNLFPTELTTYDERLKWIKENRSNQSFLDALIRDPEYQELLSSSFESRVPPEVARLSMGRPGSYREAVALAGRDFSRWNAQAENRLTMSRWASEKNSRMIILIQEQRDDGEILQEVQDSVTQENIPVPRVRRSIERVIRSGDIERLQRLLRFIIDAFDQYSYVDSAQQWIVALSRPQPSHNDIPPEVFSYFVPQSAIPDELLRSIGKFEEYSRFSDYLIRWRAREEMRAMEAIVDILILFLGIGRPR